MIYRRKEFSSHAKKKKIFFRSAESPLLASRFRIDVDNERYWLDREKRRNLIRCCNEREFPRIRCAIWKNAKQITDNQTIKRKFHVYPASVYVFGRNLVKFALYACEWYDRFVCGRSFTVMKLKFNTGRAVWKNNKWGKKAARSPNETI